MSRLIEVGDTVKVCYSDDTAETGFKVLHTPSDTGDMWYLKDWDGGILAINPMSSMLLSIVLEKKGGSDD